MMHSGDQTWLEQDASEASEAALDGPAMLELLPPQQLPVEMALAPEEAEIVRATLSVFLRAIGDPQPERRASRVRRLLSDLGPGQASEAPVGETSIPIDTAEVEDYDRYFCVRRIHSDAVGLALLRGLLQTAAAVLSLSARGPGLPEEMVARQVAGFATYARLLARICNLGRLA